MATGGVATGCNRNEGREERGHLEIGETGCQHLHYVCSQLLLLCESVCHFPSLSLLHAGHVNLVPGSG